MGGLPSSAARVARSSCMARHMSGRGGRDRREGEAVSEYKVDRGRNGGKRDRERQREGGSERQSVSRKRFLTNP